MCPPKRYFFLLSPYTLLVWFFFNAKLIMDYFGRLNTQCHYNVIKHMGSWLFVCLWLLKCRFFFSLFIALITPKQYRRNWLMYCFVCDKYFTKISKARGSLFVPPKTLHNLKIAHGTKNFEDYLKSLRLYW